MNIAKVFSNGRSQAIRLPKEFRVKGKEIYINKINNIIVLFPKNKAWGSLEKSLNKFSEDFMSERNQPDYDKREIFQ